VTIFGQVEGEIVADELTISGHVKGTVHANRVKLNSTAVVEEDIFYRTLAIEENARFEGMVRRNENTMGNDSSDGRAADLGPNFKASLRRLLTR
jgi:cytoskeletal protein CcmA (bactofilin family)